MRRDRQVDATTPPIGSVRDVTVLVLDGCDDEKCWLVTPSPVDAGPVDRDRPGRGAGKAGAWRKDDVVDRLVRRTRRDSRGVVYVRVGLRRVREARDALIHTIRDRGQPVGRVDRRRVMSLIVVRVDVDRQTGHRGEWATDRELGALSVRVVLLAAAYEV